MTRFASLWESKEFADLELQLVTPAQNEGTPKQEITSIHLHMTLLIGEGDNYFKGRLRYDQSNQDQSAVGDKRSREGEQPVRNAEGMLIMKEHCHAEEMPAIVAILKFLYLEELPQDALVVAEVALKSDYWGFHRCTDAAIKELDRLAKLSGATAITEQVLNLIMDVYPDLLVSKVLGMAYIRAQLGRNFKKTFRDVYKILTDAAVMQSWSELSYRQMLMWSSDDDLSGDQENSVALLIMAWLNKAAQPEGVEANPAQRKQLWRNVRLQHLSPSFYLQVLPKGPFYDRSSWPEEEHQAAVQGIMAAMISTTIVKPDLGAAYGHYPDPEDLPKMPDRQWSLGRKFNVRGRVLLQEGSDATAPRVNTARDADGCRLFWHTVQKAASGDGNSQPVPQGPSIYLAGYLWNCMTSRPTPDKAACFLRSYLHPVVCGESSNSNANILAAVVQSGLLPSRSQDSTVSVGVALKDAAAAMSPGSEVGSIKYCEVLTLSEAANPQLTTLLLDNYRYALSEFPSMRVSSFNVVVLGVL